MKILLINPRSRYLDNDASYPPIGLMYLAAAFEQYGSTVKILDLTCQESEFAVMTQQNKFNDYDLIGFTCVTPNVDEVKTLIKSIPRDIPVMIGGAHPTFVENQIWCDGYTRDITTVAGEGETLVPLILSDLKTGLKPRYIGKNTPVGMIPLPARHLVNLHKYSPGGKGTTPIYGSRGCPYQCNFCARVSGCEYRMMPDERIMREIALCKKEGYNYLQLSDDNFTVNIPRALRLFEQIKQENITFRLNQDSRVLKEEVYKAAADAGCVDISIGIESGSQRILDLMNKQTTVEKNLQMINLAKKYNIKVRVYLMVNFPGETIETVNETIDFIKQAKPDSWLLSNFTPLPGCEVYNNREKYGINWISDNWSDFYSVGKHGSFAFNFTTQYLTKARQQYHHDYLYESLKKITP